MIWEAFYMIIYDYVFHCSLRFLFTLFYVCYLYFVYLYMFLFLFSLAHLWWAFITSLIISDIKLMVFVSFLYRF